MLSILHKIIHLIIICFSFFFSVLIFFLSSKLALPVTKISLISHWLAISQWLISDWSDQRDLIYVYRKTASSNFAITRNRLEDNYYDSEKKKVCSYDINLVVKTSFNKLLCFTLYMHLYRLMFK